MLSWYHGFMLAVAFLWLVATERDRPAVRIIFLATLGSFLVVNVITHQIEGAWKLVIPGAVETVTILALFRWSRNRTGYVQIAMLVVAWLAHVICYVDLICATDLVYSRYETILALVALGQIAAFHDTLRHVVRGLVAWAAAVRDYHSGAFRGASVCDPVLRDKGHPEL